MNHNSNQQKFFQLLGLAMRARSILTGDGICLQAIRQGQAKAAILAEDAGPNTFKKYHDKCRSYQVPLVVMGDKDTLGQALGKEQRAVIVVTQDGFANRLLELARENNGGDGFDENASL